LVEHEFDFHNKRISGRQRKKFNKPTVVKTSNLFKFGKGKASLILLTLIVAGIAWYSNHLQTKLGNPSGSIITQNGITYRLYIRQPENTKKIRVSVFIKNISSLEKKVTVYTASLSITESQSGKEIFKKNILENIKVLLDPRQTESYEFYAGGIKSNSVYKAVFILTDKDFNKIKLHMEIKSK
jgi:hypothetical protein